ncbi:tyrosyl-DNA phosphodiesterase domain protein [Aspergillus luchuensis IFO 4308]|nr:tyrosyl-DNA phosphodiesterase domain protein [Aspergillus luchuensis IFO 4308]
MAPHEGERQFETFDLDSEPDQRRSSERQVVDLTAESDSDDVIPIFPKSRSVIGSDTDDEAGDDDQYDEDLKRAIALSLQDAQGRSQNASSYPQTSGSEKGEPQGTDSPSVKEVEEKTNGPEPAKPMGIFGLDRKQMEQERLARLAKRKAEDTSSIDLRETKHSKIDLALKPTVQPTVATKEGIVKKTWAFGCPRQGDDIKIEEVLQKSDLELAVLSSFMWEMDWLFSKFNVESTRFIMVMQAEDEATSVFLIDLPKKNGAEKPTTHFYEDLVHFLKASTLHENVIAKLDSFDFSKTSKYAFVHTMYVPFCY